MRTLHGADKKQRLAARYIPTGARLVPGPAGCAVYAYQTASAFFAIGFWGSAAKSSFHHSFRTEEQRAQHIAAFFNSVKSSLAFKQTRKAEKAAWINPLTVGTILYTSWGYDQTNTEFYVVTRVSGRRVWIREIASDYESTGSMSGKSWPAMPIRMIGDETMHTAQPNGKDVAIKIDHHYAYIEQGREHYTSSYA